MPHNYVTIWLNSLVIIEMQIKTTTRYHFLPISLAKIRKVDNAKCWQEFMKLECLRTSAGGLEWHRGYQGQSANTLVNTFSYFMFSIFLSIHSVSVKMSLAALFMVAERGRLPGCSSLGWRTSTTERSTVWNSSHKLDSHPAVCIHFKIIVQTGGKKSNKQWDLMYNMIHVN